MNEWKRKNWSRAKAGNFLGREDECFHSSTKKSGIKKQVEPGRTYLQFSAVLRRNNKQENSLHGMVNVLNRNILTPWRQAEKKRKFNRVDNLGVCVCRLRMNVFNHFIFCRLCDEMLCHLSMLTYSFLYATKKKSALTHKFILSSKGNILCWKRFFSFSYNF